MTQSDNSASSAAGGQVALWRQLQQVAQVVQRIHAGATSAAALEQVPAALRPGVQALAYEVLRGWGIGQWLRAQLVPRQPAPLLDALLSSALALAWRAGEAGAQAMYSDFTLVNQTVEAAKRHPQLRHQGGMVNAVLRRYLREQADLRARCEQDSPQHDPALRNVPRWWLQQLQQDHGDAVAARIVRQGLQAAPMTLRVHAGHMTAADYLQQHLLPAGLEGVLNGLYGVTLHKAVPVQLLPGFAEGWVSVQDGAAQLAAPLLLQGLPQDRPLRVLDACAAPGGKTAHLLELGAHQVTALEVDPARCERIHDNLRRLGLQAQVIATDAADTARWWDGQPFDGILLDAPCTASGIVRRHPDVPWLRRKQDIAQLAAQQKRLLQALWPLLRPGGRLLYCTCSVFKQEGEQQAQAFAHVHPDAQRLPAPGHLLPIDNKCVSDSRQNGTLGAEFADVGLPDHDGFFYALYAKRP